MLNKATLCAAMIACMSIALAASNAKAQSNSKEIMALPPAQLVALLQKADATEFEKAKACQRLAVVGTKDAIPALVALLPDEHLNLYARFGLEGIPDPAVDDALREAATKLQGRQQVGVIDSIGQRRDAKAIDLLKGLLANSDPALASAAAGALGRIGNSEAAGALKAALAQPMPLRGDIADGSLACAEQLAAAGKKDEALAIYAAVSQADVAKHVKIAAVTGQLATLQAEGKDVLLAQLQNADLDFFRIGLAAARKIQGAEIGNALSELLGKLPAERQALLLLALGDRKEGVPQLQVLALAKSDSPAVREAAVVVLARKGDATALPILLDAAASDGPVAIAAREGLKSLQGEGIDAAVVARLTDAKGNAKAVLFDIAGARRIAAAYALARQSMAATDESERLAAIVAMGQLVELADIDLLMGQALAAADTPQRKAAQEALSVAARRIADRDAVAAKLSGAIAGLTIENQTLLLELLGRIAGPKALGGVVVAARSDDDGVKNAATKVLGDWPNAEAADSLLDLAKTDKDAKYRIRALRGYIRIARQLQLPDDKRLAMFRTAMEVAKRPDDQQIALEILSRIPSVETMQLAVSYLGDANLKSAAGDSAVKIAAKVITTNPKEVADAMEKVVKAEVGGKSADVAKQLLDQAKANSN